MAIWIAIGIHTKIPHETGEYRVVVFMIIIATFYEYTATVIYQSVFILSHLVDIVMIYTETRHLGFI